MLSKLLQRIVFLLTVILFFTACSKNDPSVNATRLRIKLTDAPVLSVSEFNVDIQKIEIAIVDGTTDKDNWQSLKFDGGVYNILPLSNGKSKQIVDQYFPVGVTQRIKITFGDKSTLKISSRDIKNLILDPSIKDGVVLDVTANLYANYITSIMIDINAALSFYESNGNYFFKPVLRVFPETFGGSLKGYALPEEANPVVSIIKDEDTLYTIPERADGMFQFKGLQEGVWKIRVLSAASLGYRDTLFTDTVSIGKTRELKSKIVLKK
ncbi:MAG: DUF4382 domain-containing protein [Bacteroidia bacterium]|nr:DUF4382 domain-containing protein [Bacteroidia bacterium]